MNISQKKFSAVLLAACVASALSIQAQTLIDTFSYAGGALNPATYGVGVYQPANLISDTGSTGGGGIGVTNMNAGGGLGSSSYSEGYGGIYTLGSTPTFSYSTNTVLTGVETVTISLLSGGLTGFALESVKLNYNLGGTQALQALSFSSVAGGSVDSPLGVMPVTLYTWTWNVSELGAINALNLRWGAGQHVFIDEIIVTQAVPEPSTYVLIGLGLVAVVFLRKRLRSGTSV